MASAYLTSDLDAFFADPFFSVPVVMGAESTRGVFDFEDVVRQDTAGLDVLVKHRVLTIRTGTLSAALKAGATLTVDGVGFTVHDTNRQDDGLLTDVVLVT